MSRHIGLTQARREFDRAVDNLIKSIEEIATKTVKTLAEKNPEHEYEFMSSMGGWFFEKDGEEFKPQPAYRIIQRAEMDYGYGYTLPQPFRIKAKGTQVTVLREW